MSRPLRTFEHFPTDKPCPVCGEADDAPCVLVAKDGTERDNIVEAVPVHLGCAVATNCKLDYQIFYTRGQL